MIVANHYFDLLDLLRSRRKDMTALEIEEALGDLPPGIYMRLRRMVSRGWLAKDGTGYRITDLGRLAHDYGRAERDGQG